MAVIFAVGHMTYHLNTWRSPCVQFRVLSHSLKEVSRSGLIDRILTSWTGGKLRQRSNRSPEANRRCQVRCVNDVINSQRRDISGAKCAGVGEDQPWRRRRSPLGTDAENEWKKSYYAGNRGQVLRWGKRRKGQRWVLYTPITASVAGMRCRLQVERAMISLSTHICQTRLFCSTVEDTDFSSNERKTHVTWCEHGTSQHLGGKPTGLAHALWIQLLLLIHTFPFN